MPPKSASQAPADPSALIAAGDGHAVSPAAAASRSVSTADDTDEIADRLMRELQGDGAGPGSLQHIRVRGARTHNLKNVDLDLPKNALVVL